MRIKSPGDDGDVTQTNAALAGAAAGNANSTTQNADQSQSGDSCKCGGGGGTQAVGQSADSKQSADADADATQIKPSNSNISVRIGSEGNGGDVTQTNAALAGALAGNVNQTDQSADQSQSADGCKCHGGGGVQAVGQEAGNKQSATSDANAVQYKPSNDNTSVRIHSPGDDGDVTQTNLAGALGIAFNANQTDQSVTQSQGGDSCKCSGTPVQAVGQFAYNDQYADAEANAYQIKPSNSNTPVRIGSPGNGGSVTQTNAALAAAVAGNLNLTSQSTTQSQAGGGGVQAVGQEAGSKQGATADANAFQLKPSNSNAPVSIGDGHDKKHECGCKDEHEGGSGGDVTQTNLAGALGVALNANITDQSVTQTQGGDSCKCSGGGLQAVGQSAWNKQDATADANAFQLKPSNSNTPVSIGDGHDKKHECGCKDEHEGGSGGDVTQTNLAGALGIALNANITDQSVTQTQGGGPGMKDAGYDPKAGYGDMGGYGDKGGYGKKDDDHGCGCSGGGTQAVGQSAWNKQDADASANAFQLWASNDNSPVRIGSAGNSGSVTQTNAALAFSLAANLNKLNQEATQTQS